MDLKEKTAAELRSRLTAIADEVESNEDANLDALEEEARSIKAELETRKNAESEKAEARKEAVNASESDSIKIPKKEERKMFTVDTKEYRDAWLAQMMGKELTEEVRGQITATNAIPTITENRIINRLKENALLSKIDLLQIPGYVTIPVYGTNGDAAWSSSNEQADVIDKITLTPYQLIKTIEVPATVDAMSIDAFESYIVEAIGNKLETAIQTAIITGDGSSKPTGINVTHSTADGTFTKAAITKQDLMKIMGKLPAQYLRDAVWIMPNALLFECMAIADIKGFAGVAEGIGYQIGGKPVVVDDACIISSTDTIFFGGAKAYHLNLGKGIELAKDTSVGFKSGAVNYRGICLADGKLDNTNAFVKFTRATA